MSEPGSSAPARRHFLPPHIVRRDFLSPAMVAGLLDFAQANQSRFAPAKVYGSEGGAVKPQRRVASTLRDFAPLKAELRRIVAPLAGAIAAELRVSPFETTRVELELAAHGDGAFFSRHIDTLRNGGASAAGERRLLSGVYYFHAEPKAFEGGALRLHEIPLGEGGEQFVDIEPAHNSAVFFPAWMPHEVMQVRCPSGRFMDSRFAINCWFHGKQI